MLSGEFEMTNLGLTHLYLGIELWQEPNQGFISLQKYVGEILKKLCMAKCKSVGFLMEVGVKLSMEDSSPLVDKAMYIRLGRSFIYLCNM